MAFCLNHLLLKTLWVPRAAADLMLSFGALWDGYRERVDWEPPAELEESKSQCSRHALHDDAADGDETHDQLVGQL